MRTTLLVIILATAALLAPGLLDRPVEAGVFWSVGSVFSVGGLDFAFVLGRPYGAYGEAYYYRTHRPLHYRGYECHGACSYRAGAYYHHRNCSVVRHYFRQHRFYPERHVRFEPRYYGSYGRYDWRRYDRHRTDHRTQRYDRYRSDDHRRYDRHRTDDRYRRDGHRADRSRSHTRGSVDRYEGRGSSRERDRAYDRRGSRRDSKYDADRHKKDKRRGRGQGHNK